MKYYLYFLLTFLPLVTWGQVPVINPTITYYMTNEEGEEETDVITSEPNDGQSNPLNAPVRMVFQANPSRPFPDGFSDNVHYDWTITGNIFIRDNVSEEEETRETKENIIKRNEEEFEITFNESGTYTVQLHAIFYDENDEDIIYEFPEEGEDPKTLTFTISESQLEFPNGISPNGDDKNDELKPKAGFKNIVSFHAAVFNRWGKKLYSWDNVHGSWNGKVNGKPVKDGVYFLNVSAKGSDGINYSIKKAINVISGYNNGENEGGTDGE